MTKIRAGQVWGRIMLDSPFDLRTITRLSDARVHYVKPCGTIGWLNRSKFVEDYELIKGEWVKQCKT